MSISDRQLYETLKQYTDGEILSALRAMDILNDVIRDNWKRGEIKGTSDDMEYLAIMEILEEAAAEAGQYA